MPPRLPFVIGILAWCFIQYSHARASTRVRLPMPTSETIPYVAEVMGATSYEESIEESSGEVKRVQRKLTGPEHKEQDLDQDEQFAEYQGVIGRPGVDFPVLPGIPRTDFNCRKVKSSGYYADLETGCQVFHICDGGRKISFLCPNGTIFRQSHLICDWWFRVDCERSVEQYEESAEQLAHDQMIYKKRAEEIAKAMTAKPSVTEAPRTSISVSYNQRQQVQQQRQQQQQQQRLQQQQERQQQQQQRQQQQQQQQQRQQQQQQQLQQQQQFQQRKPASPQNYDQVEHERQVPAETASFVSNKHRFGNQLENQYREYYATSTNPPPSSFGTSFDYNSQQYTQQYQEAQSPVQQNSFESNKQKLYDNSQLINSNKNNFPNKANYQVNVQSSYSTSTTNNFPTSNNYPSSFENTNYQSTTSQPKSSINNTPAPNKIIPSRGSINYLNSNVGIENSQRYTDSPSYSSTDNGNIYTSTSQKYVDHPSSQPQALPLQGQSTQNNYTPHASTTVRSVSSYIGSYNDNTQRPEKYAGLKQKPIFNVKIKPTKDTKDIAYVELLRQDEKNYDIVTPEIPVYSSPSSSTQEGKQYTIPVSHLVTTLAPPSVTETKTRNTYLPKQTTEKKEIITPVTNRYASINVSGTSEEIRPEVVNALMENGVTPTSAKALHSLASYISSGAAEEDFSNVYDDGSHPHVSDVILNFHSGSPVITKGSESTTSIPLTSSDEELPSVLTKATKESYSYLFSDSKEQVDYKNEESKLDIETSTPKTRSTTAASISQTTVKQEGKEDLKLKDSSELRELAQVFSRALSAYLEDPETFKEILAQVRPTEPNADSTTPSVEDEVLDFSDAMLGRLGTTVPPVTSLDYIDDNLNIGEINSLVSGKSYEQDNSLEHNTFPPTAPESLQDSQYTSATPKLLYFNRKNDSQSNYYAKLGSAEDQSYFPTVGGVSDTSRPRYGGFQNNTNKKPYSPYGSDIPKNITGSPISSPRPPTSPQAQSFTKRYNSSTTVQNLPEPHDVNSLIKSNVLNGDQVSSEETFDNYQTSPSFLQEEAYYSSADQEKVLVASGSQSLVSSNNYVQFAKKFNEQQIQDGKKQQERFYKTNQQGKPVSSSLSAPVNTPEDLTSYFGQEPPLENLGRPSGFKAHDSKQASGRNNNNKANFIKSDPINYHIGSESLSTSSPIVSSSLNYEATHRSSSSQSGWTVSPAFDVSSAGTSVNFNYTQKPVSSSPNKYHPTTYHPPHSSESVEVVDGQWESTYQTEGPSEETTPAYDSIVSATTLSTDDQYKTFAKAAKEMFGNLNETAAIKLMNMMVQGESNMTIRRLVLLLVNDKVKENITTQESRESLINALLTNTDESMTTLPVQPVSSTTTPPAPRKKVRVSRVRVSSASQQKTEQRSGKSYRGTDSMTAVHGSIPSPADLNKINSAKLYIPSPSAAALTSGQLPLDSDARAVELLKTLYSLAAKWG